MKRTNIEAAVIELRRRIDAGQEYPDASSAVGVQFGIAQDALGDAYDEADADELADAARTDNQSFSFVVVAIDETEHWSDAIKANLKPGDKIFGSYIVCLEERTHCCELTASQWFDFLENIFPDDFPESMREDLQFESGDDSGHYRHARRDWPLSSPVRVFEADSIDEAREMAREDFHANSPCIAGI